MTEPRYEQGDFERDIREAVKQMAIATQAMRTLIDKEYPTRREMEARFVEKVESRRTLVIAVVVGLISAILSFFGTISTVSTCFLGGDTEHPAVCSFMPGYDESQRQSEEFFKEFERMRQQIEKNRRGIE